MAAILSHIKELQLASDLSPLPHLPNHLIVVRKNRPVVFNMRLPKAWPMHPVMPQASLTHHRTLSLTPLTPHNTMNTPPNTMTVQDPPPFKNLTFESRRSPTDFAQSVPLASVHLPSPKDAITVDCVGIFFAMHALTIASIYHWRESNSINL